MCKWHKPAPLRDRWKCAIIVHLSAFHLNQDCLMCNYLTCSHTHGFINSLKQAHIPARRQTAALTRVWTSGHSRQWTSLSPRQTTTYDGLWTFKKAQTNFLNYNGYTAIRSNEYIRYNNSDQKSTTFEHYDPTAEGFPLVYLNLIIYVLIGRNQTIFVHKLATQVQVSGFCMKVGIVWLLHFCTIFPLGTNFVFVAWGCFKQAK